VRKRAADNLKKMGRLAGPALRKALESSPSAEQRRRIEQLLEALDVFQAQDTIASRAVEVLEWVGTLEARRLLEEFAGGAPGAYLTEEAAGACRRLRRESGPSP
jgi:hypothetical protein